MTLSTPPLLTHVRHWVFDLDNTLYPADAVLWGAIGARMTDFVAHLTGLPHPEAEALQERYLLEYGATIVGLMKHHGVAGADFMDFVHDVDMNSIAPNPDLRAAIAALPGNSYVFTNGAKGYANKLLARIGLDGLFADVIDLETLGFAPKPEPAAFERFLDMTGVDPERAVLFEDTPRNLATAAQFGFSTVLVRHVEGGDHRVAPDLPYVDAETWDLTAFLRALT